MEKYLNELEYHQLKSQLSKVLEAAYQANIYLVDVEKLKKAGIKTIDEEKYSLNLQLISLANETLLKLAIPQTFATDMLQEYFSNEMTTTELVIEILLLSANFAE